MSIDIWKMALDGNRANWKRVKQANVEVVSQFESLAFGVLREPKTVSMRDLRQKVKFAYSALKG
jgi:hypothetical protein